jgi:hypothetical protein
MRETMAERLKRQRDEYEVQISELSMDLDHAREMHLVAVKRIAKLEAKLELLAVLLREDQP